MPNMNGTGPEGKGPMTGKGRGKCIVPLDTYEHEFVYLKSREQALKRELGKMKIRMDRLKKRKISSQPN